MYNGFEVIFLNKGYIEVQNFLKNNNLNKKNFAEKVGISKQLFYYHFQNLKKGKVSFTDQQLKKIVSLTNISYEFFYS